MKGTEEKRQTPIPCNMALIHLKELKDKKKELWQESVKNKASE